MLVRLACRVYVGVRPVDAGRTEFGLLSVGEEAKLLGPVDNSAEALAILEYLRQKSFTCVDDLSPVAGGSR